VSAAFQYIFGNYFPKFKKSKKVHPNALAKMGNFSVVTYSFKEQKQQCKADRIAERGGQRAIPEAQERKEIPMMFSGNSP